MTTVKREPVDLTFYHLFCPDHQTPILKNGNVKYVCPLGCEFPIIHDIGRFVPLENYASAFGMQWNRYRTTQLDSFTGISISQERLKRLLGGSLDILKGKNVLEAGCGAGRFTEIMLQTGAQVFAVDISTAVEANYSNCKIYPNYYICQADIIKLPVLPESFDIVIGIGMIQHTPSPEKTMTTLCSYLKPGGLLVMDHYSRNYPITPIRRLLRNYLLKRSKKFSMFFCRTLTFFLWPLHKILWVARSLPGISGLRTKFLHVSPVVDYHDAYGKLDSKLLFKWAMLDTHDTLTDYYKHLRSADEIRSHLKGCGMTEIDVVYAGNGLEARAKKPLSSHPQQPGGN